MPKQARKPEEIELFKEKILNAALKLISEDGFNTLSMRKLGASLDIAAKTIYNYFENKDEIYLMVTARGFEELYKSLEKANQFNSDPFERLRAIGRAYLNFGKDHPNYYNIMFSYDVPKYSDYLGTSIEHVADMQNKTALKSVGLVSEVLTELSEKKHPFPPEDIQFKLLQIWGTLHGIISLITSRVTLEVADINDNIIDRYLEEALIPYANQIK